MEIITKATRTCKFQQEVWTVPTEVMERARDTPTESGRGIKNIPLKR